MTNSTTSLPKLLSRKNRAWTSFDFVADGHPHKIPADGTHTDWTPPAFRGPFREGNIIGLARGGDPVSLRVARSDAAARQKMGPVFGRARSSVSPLISPLGRAHHAHGTWRVREHPPTPPRRRLRSISADRRYAAILSISILSQSVRNVRASRSVSK